MPSVPTSLLLVLLVAAWIWVLVPMFARSREAVPQSDDDAAGFRILRRPGRAGMARVGSRTTGEVETVQDNTMDADQPRERASDGGVSDGSFGGADGSRGFTGTAETDSVRADSTGVRGADGADSADGADGDHGAADAHGADADDSPTQQLPRLRDSRSGSHRGAVLGTGAGDADAVDADTLDAETELDADAGADRPVRRHKPGRGGFDPEHAAATARYKYRRRRMITLVLAGVTALLLAGALLVSSSLWIGVVAGVLALAGYLGYLSRTVRIEREISERRMARLRRARELRPFPVQQPQPRSPYQQPARRVAAAAPSGRDAAVAPAGQLPPHGRTLVRRDERDERDDHAAVAGRAPASAVGPGRAEPGRYTVVDLDDDDPAFDDLDMYEPVVYRRAAGQ